MALRLSTGIRNFMLQDGSLKDALEGGELRIYSGTQPSSANTAPSGTLLATITTSSGARTAEVLSTGTVTITGASGTVDTITVDGVNLLDEAVSFNSSLTQTAADVASAINRAQSSPEYRATSSSTVVTIIAKRGSGALPNALVVSGSSTTLSLAYTDMASGVTPVNGLRMGVSTGGTLVKHPTDTWTGVGVANGTAGWFRFVGAVVDANTTDALEYEIRVDGQIATSGAELNLPSLSVATSAVQTITSLQFSLPAS